MPEMPIPLGTARNVRLLVLGATVPAVINARSRKNLPLSGISEICLLVITSPRFADSVWTPPAAPSAVIKVVASPTRITGSIRDLSSRAKVNWLSTNVSNPFCSALSEYLPGFTNGNS